MTPKSLILTGDEVRAFLNVKPNTWPPEPIDPTKPWKWQYRVPIKPQPDSVSNKKPYWDDTGFCLGKDASNPWPKSLGPVGRRVWGKETWADVNTEVGPAILYKADGGFRSWEEFSTSFGPNYGAGPSMDYKAYPGNYTMWWSDLLRNEPSHSWRSVVHMPRWASRLELETKALRVERVQDISEEDCWAEGIPQDEYDRCEHYQIGGSPLQGGNPERCAFAGFWTSRHSPDSWNKNEWVFVYEFMRVK